MPRLCQSNSQIEKIYKNLQAYLKNEKVLPKESNIRTLSANEIANSRYGGCAGEIEFNKTLPNGKIQKRVVTVYNNGSIGTATAVTTPNGELYKVYYGVRDRVWNTTQPEVGNVVETNASTREYDSGLSIKILNKTIKKLFYK